MKRRTLDFIFVAGGLMLAALLAILGLVLRSNANFAKTYVSDQLSEQLIFFPPTERLQTEEAWRAALLEDFGGDTARVEEFITANGLTAEANSECLQKFSRPAAEEDRLLDTGKAAECYANDYIRLHMKDGSIIDGQWYTYASIGGLQRELRTQVADAKAANDPNLPALEEKLATVNSARDTLFRGESLRGLLLTSYGFSVFGEKADLAATVSFLAALVLLLASLAGLIHALRTPKTELVGHHGESVPAADTPPAVSV